MRLVVTVQDRGLVDFSSRMEKLAAGSGRAMLAQALNDAGHGMREKTVAAETAQTGLKSAVIERAQHEVDASASSLSFTIASGGGDVRLKFFGAHEQDSGVISHPWNKNEFIPGAFTRAGGGFGGPRVDLPWGGEVKQRKGSGRLPLKTTKSGLFIPVEMVKGQTAAAFEAGFASVASVIISKLGALL